MKKLLSAVAAIAILAGATLAGSSDALAQRRGGAVGLGILGGLVGGAIIGSAIANAYGPQYVVEPGWAPYRAYRVGPPVDCPGGYWARRPVVDAYGNVVGYSRPRFFCPEY